jgi:hypothetical protein
MSMLHAVADGHAVWMFMKAWSAATQEGSITAAGLPPPTFDRAGVRHPKADELAATMPRVFAPALPLVSTTITCFDRVKQVHTCKRKNFITLPRILNSDLKHF